MVAPEITKPSSLPFTLADLTAKENYKIPVYPENQHWLVAMKEKKSQHPEDSKPAEKLMKVLVEIHPGVWGFELPKKCCVFVAESNLIKKQASARNEAILAYARLCQRISKGLKKPINKVQNMLREPFKHMEVLDRWMEEITSSLTNLEATDMGFATVTVIIQQRLAPHWTEHDTLSLPESLFNVFLDYTTNEQNAWKPLEAEIEIEENEDYEEARDSTEVLVEDEVSEEIEGKEEVKAIAPSKDS